MRSHFAANEWTWVLMDGPCFLCYCLKGFFGILAPLCVGSVRRYSRSFVSCEMRSYCLLTRDKVKRLKGYRMSVQHNLPWKVLQHNESLHIWLCKATDYKTFFLEPSKLVIRLKDYPMSVQQNLPWKVKWLSWTITWGLTKGWCRNGFYFYELRILPSTVFFWAQNWEALDLNSQSVTGFAETKNNNELNFVWPNFKINQNK